MPYGGQKYIQMGQKREYVCGEKLMSTYVNAQYFDFEAPIPRFSARATIDVRAGWHRRKLGFSARLLKSAFRWGLVVAKAKGVLKMDSMYFHEIIEGALSATARAHEGRRVGPTGLADSTATGEALCTALRAQPPRG